MAATGPKLKAGWLFGTSVVIHLVVGAGLWGLLSTVYSGPVPPLSQWGISAVTWVLLCGGALGGGLFAGVGVWSAVAYAKPWSATVQVVFLGLPSVLLACLWAFALLIFQGWA